jgi:hypothetical protein
MLLVFGEDRKEIENVKTWIPNAYRATNYVEF